MCIEDTREETTDRRCVGRGEHKRNIKEKRIVCKKGSTREKRRKFKRGVKTEKKSQVDTRDVCVCVVCVRAQ